MVLRELFAEASRATTEPAHSAPICPLSDPVGERGLSSCLPSHPAIEERFIGVLRKAAVGTVFAASSKIGGPSAATLSVGIPVVSVDGTVEHAEHVAHERKLPIEFPKGVATAVGAPVSVARISHLLIARGILGVRKPTLGCLGKKHHPQVVLILLKFSLGYLVPVAGLGVVDRIFGRPGFLTEDELVLMVVLLEKITLLPQVLQNDRVLGVPGELFSQSIKWRLRYTGSN